MLALAFAAVCVGVVAVLGLLLHGARATRVDDVLLAVVPGTVPVRSAVLTDLAALGSGPVVAVATAGLALLLAVHRRWRAAALTAVAPAATALATEGLKRLVDRSIWTDSMQSYPSGHVACATALLLAAVVVRLQRTTPTLAHAVRSWGCATCAALLLGAVVVLVGAHYPTDVLGGYCTGAAITVAAAAALRLLPADRPRRPPRSPRRHPAG